MAFTYGNIPNLLCSILGIKLEMEIEEVDEHILARNFETYISRCEPESRKDRYCIHVKNERCIRVFGFR